MSEAGSYYPGELSPDGRWRWDGTEWRPASSSATFAVPAWLNLRLRRQATWLTLASAVAVGFLVDQAVEAGNFGLAAALTLVAAAVVAVTVGGLRRVEPRLLAVVAGVFGGCLALRASPWLLWPDLALAVGSLFLAASYSADGSLSDVGSSELIARAANALAHLTAGAAFISRPIVSSRHRLSAFAPVARGLLIAAPICAVLAVLLASADPVFASFFSLNVDIGRLATDVVLVVLGAAAMAGVLRLASAEPVARVDGPAWRLGATETLVVLVVLDAVFAAFATAQVLAAAGAAAATLKSAGVTYSEYARSGFFQLLWVAGITLVLLILFSRITALSKPEHRWAFIILCEIAIALTLMLVVVAFRRLSLYEDAYGFTMLRLYSHLFAGWIAFVFVLLGLEVLGFGRRRRWFVGATISSAMVILLALNLANPEAALVALNVSHAATSHKIDAGYLSQLSSDATPALLEAAPALDPSLRGSVRQGACRGPRSYQPSFWAFNWSDDQAANARRATCT